MGPDQPRLDPSRRPFRGEQPAGIWSLHERLYRPAELVERVSEAGFLIERVEEATHYGFPFIHFAVYGIGKPLVERRLLPDGLRRSVDRLAGEEGRRDSPSLLSHGVALFRAVDRLNDHPSRDC